ncbi:EPS I polysaccharide export outer membrane protein EPSA precursor [Pseudanabaena sp. lw0831]|uniref:polysaccharide biosynthesis/export family protein n=1 Tax=Pseudanabaena sp. lw0831 TaxID=1357935 RepID=UPI001A29A029|nr:polysaccharide biosynthesis/export family protein [Pseudanabaena sp. lw0831]GBO54647.1 EPS I polysaccharide export outer membrane protein EPSA precursor [Pseudanabaena sp. lw0831]
MAQSSDRKVKTNKIKVLGSITIAAIAINILTGQPISALPLSPGDRLRLLIPEGELFNGVYEVNIDGTISIPYLPALPVVGLEIPLLEAQIKNQLIEKKYFQAQFVQVSVTPLVLAPIEVNVSGETFQPGRVQINNRSPEIRAQQLSQSSGDYAPERFLTSALRAAGGVMPTADITQITVIRQNKKITVDFTGIFTGEEVTDIPLVAGDVVVVPKRQGIDSRIVRPSQITPPGILVFLSNLSIPANSNSTAGINKDSTGFPYGARFSQAVVAANCVGGTTSTNAARRAVLVRANRETGETVAIDRAVEDLIRNSKDDVTNPFLMPQDSVSCYDSTVTEVRGILDFIGDILNPIKIIRDIFGGSNR